jgi:type II secretory pathway component PulF
VVADQRSLAPELEVLSDMERVGAYRARLDRVRLQVESGIPLPMALHDEGFVSVREAAALESATALQHLPWTLRAIANKMLDRRQQGIRWLLTIGEPLLLITMGLIVGLFTVGLFLPIVKLLMDLT